MDIGINISDLGGLDSSVGGNDLGSAMGLGKNGSGDGEDLSITLPKELQQALDDVLEG